MYKSLITFFEVRHPRCVSNKSNYKLYVYIAKHNYILGGMLFTVRKAQLHVSALNAWTIFHFNVCVFILQKRQWTMDPGVHNLQYKTVYFTRSLLDLAHRIFYTTTLTIES